MQACTICAFRATVILNVHCQEKALRQGFSVALEEKVTSVPELFVGDAFIQPSIH